MWILREQRWFGHIKNLISAWTYQKTCNGVKGWCIMWSQSTSICMVAISLKGIAYLVNGKHTKRQIQKQGLPFALFLKFDSIWVFARRYILLAHCHYVAVSHAQTTRQTVCNNLTIYGNDIYSQKNRDEHQKNTVRKSLKKTVKTM